MNVDEHGCHIALYFSVKVKNNLDKVLTLYWLPKLHKDLIESTFQRDNDRNAIFTLVKPKNIMHGHVKLYM